MKRIYTLKAGSTLGHYNFLNPEQESFSIRFEYNGKNCSLNMKDFYEFNFDFIAPEEAVSIINTWLGNILYASEKDELIAFKKELEDNSDKIAIANTKAKILKNKEKIKLLRSENSILQEELVKLS